MDNTAIERIEQLAVAAASADLTQEAVPALVIPVGCEIKSIEHLLATPAFQRATYTTERLEDFCRYVDQEALAERMTAVFVKPDGSGATGFIDYGTHDRPLWGRHQAQLTMRHTPEYAALLAACGRDLDQRGLIDWLEDWAHIVMPFADDENAISVARAIQLIRRTDIKASATKTSQVGNFSNQGTTIEQIEAKSGEADPPALFAVTCQVYPCTRSRDVSARLSLKTAGDKPTFRLRIIGQEALNKEVAEEIDLEISARLKDKVRTFVGTVVKAA